MYGVIVRMYYTGQTSITEKPVKMYVIAIAKRIIKLTILLFVVVNSTEKAVVYVIVRT